MAAGLASQLLPQSLRERHRKGMPSLTVDSGPSHEHAFRCTFQTDSTIQRPDFLGKHFGWSSFVIRCMESIYGGRSLGNFGTDKAQLE
jgi:hypothetical protein